MEKTGNFNPETGKPNPVSLKEYMLMDRHEQRAFGRALDKGEKRSFQTAVIREITRLRLKDRREIQQMLVTKLEKRQNTSIGDKVELALAKMRLTHLNMPEKQPIFFRKLRTKELPLPKWITESKSPYFINTTRSVS